MIYYPEPDSRITEVKIVIDLKNYAAKNRIII